MKIDIKEYFEVRNLLVMIKFAFRAISTRPPFSKWLPKKSSNCQWSDFNENWYLGVFWSEELVGNDEICSQFHFYEATIFKMAANKIVKLSMVWFQWKLISRSILKWGMGWCPEFWYGVVWELLCLHPNTIKPSYYYYITPGDVLLFYVSFSLLLHHPDCCRVMYCYSIIIVLPRLLSGDVLLFYVSFSLLLLLLFLLLLFFHTFLSTRFLGDALIKLYETL